MIRALVFLLIDSIKNGGITKEALFISELKAEYPEIACQIDVIQQEHLQILNDLSTKKNVIKKLMQHFSISEF